MGLKGSEVANHQLQGEAHTSVCFCHSFWMPLGVCVLVSGSVSRFAMIGLSRPDNYGQTDTIAQRLAVFQGGGQD